MSGGDVGGSTAAGSGSIAGAAGGASSPVPTVIAEDDNFGENSNVLCSDGIDNDDDGRIDCEDIGCRLDTQVTICQPTGRFPTLAGRTDRSAGLQLRERAIQHRVRELAAPGAGPDALHPKLVLPHQLATREAPGHLRAVPGADRQEGALLQHQQRRRRSRARARSLGPQAAACRPSLLPLQRLRAGQRRSLRVRWSHRHEEPLPVSRVRSGRLGPIRRQPGRHVLPRRQHPLHVVRRWPDLVQPDRLLQPLGHAVPVHEVPDDAGRGRWREVRPARAGALPRLERPDGVPLLALPPAGRVLPESASWSSRTSRTPTTSSWASSPGRSASCSRATSDSSSRRTSKTLPKTSRPT